jgi:hypothetical protein
MPLSRLAAREATSRHRLVKRYRVTAAEVLRSRGRAAQAARE